MRLTLRDTRLRGLDVPLLVVAVAKGAKLDDQVRALDGELGGAISRMLDGREFRAGRDEILHLVGGTKGPNRILLVGMGSVTDLPAAVRRAGMIAARFARRTGARQMAWYHGSGDRTIENATIGIALGAWEYTETKTPPPEDERRAELDEAIIISGDGKRAERELDTGIAFSEGMNLARRVAMMPGNLCTPDYLAETGREIAKRYGMKATVLGRKEMEAEGMGAFLGVAQGTPQDPKLIAIEHRRGSGAPVVLVGKGLCFDSGGISIKPAQGMELMKFDMCGAAGVLGAMETIGRLEMKANVVGLIGSTTNMPSGTAFKPGDVLKSHLGKFIEIVNTDAEGRLVLCDLLSWARRYGPAAVIDAATLTGACVIALGHTASGVFGNDESLVQEVVGAGKRASEPGWPLPLWDDFKELIKSDVADIKNSGGRAAGAISAAMFLKEFAEAFPWVHLDIAGTAYSETDLVALPKGPTGVPVGTFVEFVRGRVS
ncbi:MAG: leucyl aminopeptidase [Gemmatimonadaceae bacterium]